MKIICNSSTLIGLQNINRLDLLEKIFNTIIIPEEVYQEVFTDYKKILPFMKRETIKNRLAFEILNETLGRGESACIILYKEIDADLLILDDLKARKIAENHNIKLTGLLGILKIAREQGLITSPEKIISELTKSDFRISRQLIKSFLKDG